MTELIHNPEEQIAAQSYELYKNAFSEVNAAHPQHQGMGEQEFAVALQNPNVIKTEVEKNGERLLLPQLTPVEQFKWLNTGFYKRHFPDEMEAGQLLHFSDIPGVEPGEEVNDRLKQLADDGGVLVFDFPSTDPQHSQRLKSYLETLGVRVTEQGELAQQTYFAGQTTLKRERNRRETHLGFTEAFELAVKDGSYDQARFENGASLKTIIDPEQAKAMNKFYDDAYEVLNDEPCKQGLDPDEFLHMMTEDEEVVKIVNTVDEEIVALVLLENDLSELSWVNEEYYKERYPEKYEKGEVVWFPGLAANPNKKGGFNTQIMVDLMAQLLEKGDSEVLVVFDAGKHNTGFLDVFLNKMINDTPEVSIDIQPIASQSYQFFRLASAETVD